ncbi:MAG: alpha/beta fold hydrolase [Sphingorhabdus sp.]
MAEAFDAIHRAGPPGSQLAYRALGKGPPILLLHGWPQTSWEWRRVAPLLARQFTVIAPDMRGLGDSDRPASGYDKIAVGQNVLALLDALEIGQVDLVAHDMGVPVAYALVRAAPERARRFTMLDVPPIVPAQAMAGFAPWHFTFHAIPGLPETLVAGKAREYLTFWYGDAYPHAIGEADINEYVRTYGQPEAMRAGFDYYRAFPQDMADFADASTAKLALPVQALHGARSPLGDLVHRVAAEVCDDLTIGVIADSGHWIPEEQPKALADAIIAFHVPGEEL